MNKLLTFILILLSSVVHSQALEYSDTLLENSKTKRYNFVNHSGNNYESVVIYASKLSGKVSCSIMLYETYIDGKKRILEWFIIDDVRELQTRTFSLRPNVHYQLEYSPLGYDKQALLVKSLFFTKTKDY